LSRIDVNLSWHKNAPALFIRTELGRILEFEILTIYGSSMHLIAGCPLIFSTPFYAIFPWEGKELHGLMCSKDIEKPSVYQAVSAFVEIH